mmetsp:Transcript_24303/g.57217  ORF Transcript_24303/g.57217 Transcript_24303/m.57217 type:complete len:135 (-) Transcript_24303:447-851(-)
MTTDVEDNEAKMSQQRCPEECSVFNKTNPPLTFSEDGWSRPNENSSCWWFNCKSYNSIYAYFSCYSLNSWFSLFSVNGICGFFVVNGIWGILAVNSVFSILSMNSAFSILSRNSSFAIGCTNENYKICLGNDEN